MAYNRFCLPSARERQLRLRLAASEERCVCLLADSTGASQISGLDARLAGLEAEIKGKDRLIASLVSKNGSLMDENKALKKDNAGRKREVSRLKADLEVSYCENRELEHRLEATEKRRFEWAQRARAIAERLKDARAELRHLKARINRSPKNPSLPPSSSPNEKVIYNSREKTTRRPGGQPGHAGHRRRRPKGRRDADSPPPCSLSCLWRRDCRQRG